MTKPLAIAIDGPAGAGKSTIARILAKELAFIYVDTGALYRTVGYCALTAGADPSRAEQVAPLLKDLQLELRYVDGVQRVFANGEDVSERIRTPEVSMAASAVSALPGGASFPAPAAEGYSRQPERHYGWPGYRHGGTAKGGVESFPDGFAGRPGPHGGIWS